MKVDELFNNGGSNKKEIARLQTMAWSRHCLQVTGLNLNKFGETYVQIGNETTNQQYSWNSGKVNVQKQTVDRIGKKLPKSSLIYYLPLWDLLVENKLTTKAVKNIIADYLSPEPLQSWSFPNDFMIANTKDCKLKGFPTFLNYIEPDTPEWFFPNDGKAGPRYPLHPPIIFGDYHSLFQRGDIFGFTGLLALTRIADYEKDMESLREHLIHLYKALPSIGRLKPFNDIWRDIGKQIEKIHFKHITLATNFAPDWDLMRQQVEADTHITRRELRPRDPSTCRFMDLTEPIKYATFNN